MPAAARAVAGPGDSMTREMYVSSTPHETKVALVEDDQLAELFFERENEYTLAGSIYKGRVTRVLPGMQSAFVDIGLERDAFLYVSDFLEVPEDEESDFEEIAVSRPETFVTNNPPQESRFELKPESPVPGAGSVLEARADEFGAEAAEGNTQEFAELEESSERERGDQQEQQEQQEREFRGNRRRRRARRGRGFPESKFARPSQREEHDEAEHDHSPEPAQAPIILPGESISKYHGRGEQQNGSAVGDEPHSGAPEETQADQHESRDHEQQPIEREPYRQAEPHQPHAPILLPGESIAKYQPRHDRDAAPERDTAAAPAEPTPRMEVLKAEPEHRIPQVRESQPASSRGGGFIVLPGESIAKYQSRTDEMAREQAEHAAESEERFARQAATFVIESEPWTETLEKEIEPAEHAQIPATHVPDNQDIVATAKTEHVPASDVAPNPPTAEESGEKHAGAEARQREKFERMNVAAIFGAGAVDEEDSQFGESQSRSVPPSAIDKPECLEPAAPGVPAVEQAVGEVQVPAGAHARDEHIFGAAGAGTLEHEEIDGDEDELHPPSEEQSDSEFVEMEEESFERDAFHRLTAAEPPVANERTVEWNEVAAVGDHLTEAVKEADIDHAALADAYETEENGEFDEDLSFEEEELVEEPELELPEGQQEEAIAGTRAEVRGPSGTSGFQRAERPFDRRRGRRGGKRMLRRREQPRHHAQISDLLKEGQEVLVQIAKEPIGKKGARITSHIALPGRFLVYMPTVNHIGVSRKITSDEERQRLKRIMLSEREGGHGGFIVRTAAAGVGEDELRADIRFLKNLWAQIRQRADSGKAPALIYHDLNLVERILRDLVTSDFAQVWVDNEQEYERIVNFANRFQPSLVRRVKLYTKETPLFEQFGIHEEINKALKSKVWLKSGGYIVINQTEALVAIDVNTGKYVGKTARLEDTIVKTNVDAIREIVRQIRLRDLGGIIVIDFIDMDERKNRQKVMLALEDALKSDRSPSKVLAFNDFGLVAITRKRVKQSLERTLGSPCPYCSGNGFVKSVTSVCNEIYTELRKMRSHFKDTDVVNLRVNPEVAKALKLGSGRRLQDFEELTGRTVLVKPDALLHQEQFDIH
jgi:Rne/Rng family ribonuclease